MISGVKSREGKKNGDCFVKNPQATFLLHSLKAPEKHRKSERSTAQVALKGNNGAIEKN
jgi:hypothetical protein